MTYTKTLLAKLLSNEITLAEFKAEIQFGIDSRNLSYWITQIEWVDNANIDDYDN